MQYSVFELDEPFSVRCWQIRVLCQPAGCIRLIATLDFAPTETFPIAEVDLSQGSARVVLEMESIGNGSGGSPRATKIARVYYADVSPAKLVDEQGKLSVTAAVQVGIGVTAELSSHSCFGMTNENDLAHVFQTPHR